MVPDRSVSSKIKCGLWNMCTVIVRFLWIGMVYYLHMTDPLWGESTGQRWIPLTKGQSRGKRAHAMALTMRRVRDRKRTDDCIMSYLTNWFRVKYTISFEICTLFCCRFLKDSCCPFSYILLGCYTNIVAIVWLPNAREVTLKSMCKLNLPVSNHIKT